MSMLRQYSPLLKPVTDGSGLSEPLVFCVYGVPEYIVWRRKVGTRLRTSPENCGNEISREVGSSPLFASFLALLE
jgi:hypothetical protein